MWAFSFLFYLSFSFCRPWPSREQGSRRRSGTCCARCERRSTESTDLRGKTRKMKLRNTKKEKKTTNRRQSEQKRFFEWLIWFRWKKSRFFCLLLTWFQQWCSRCRWRSPECESQRHWKRRRESKRRKHIDSSSSPDFGVSSVGRSEGEGRREDDSAIWGEKKNLKNNERKKKQQRSEPSRYSSTNVFCHSGCGMFCEKPPPVFFEKEFKTRSFLEELILPVVQL